MFATVGLAVTYATVCFIIFKVLDFLLRIPLLPPTNKFIFITGCDSGFGKELTKRLDRKRYYVLAGCLTDKGSSKLRQETSARVITFVIDVTNQESVDRVCEYVRSALPEGKGLWAVVNNAGQCGQLGPSEWTSPEGHTSTFEVNVLGALRVTNALLPLVKKERGRVVNVSCIVGRYPQPWMVPYSVSQAALQSYTHNLRREMRRFGVSVHLLEPSLFRTEFCSTLRWQTAISETWKQAPLDKKATYGEDFYHSAINALPRALDFLASEDLPQVLDAYEHALFSVFPRSRYVVGKRARFFHQLIGILPDTLGDMVLNSFIARHVLSPIESQNSENLLKKLRNASIFVMCQIKAKLKTP